MRRRTHRFPLQLIPKRQGKTTNEIRPASERSIKRAVIYARFSTDLQNERSIVNNSGQADSLLVAALGVRVRRHLDRVQGDRAARNRNRCPAPPGLRVPDDVVVGPIHPKAIPVMLATEERTRRLDARPPWDEAKALQRPLPTSVTVRRTDRLDQHAARKALEANSPTTASRQQRSPNFRLGSRRPSKSITAKAPFRRSRRFSEVLG